jgi:RecB family exonuclease
MQRLLRVEPVEQPEQIITISPLDIGNLMHETMDEFIRSSSDDLPGYGEPWTEAHRERLRRTAIDKAADFARRGVTGHARLWETERDRILADLDAMLATDNARRQDRRARVVGSELTFGKGDAAPVAIGVDGGQVLMRGSADLVEQAADGTLLVIDIKTGGASRYKAIDTDAIVGGTKLQLPVYAEAARQLLGGERAEAAYWFVRQGKRGWIELQLTEELATTYSRAVGTLTQSIATGLFPAKAPEIPDFAWVQCAYCNPDALGHGEVRTRWERKRHDPALEELVRLIDPDAVETESGDGAA